MTPYFSVLMPEEGRERAAAQAWLDGAYAEHQWLWKLFAAPEGVPRDFLYRRRDVRGWPRFHLLSQRAPGPAPDGWQLQTAVYDPDVRPGDRFRFELRANPTIMHKAEGDRRSKRHDVVMDAKRQLLAARGLQRWRDWSDDDPDKPSLYTLVQQHCGAWLRQRAGRNGFELDEDTLSIEAFEQHEHKRGALRFTSVDFSGELTVTDAEAFGAVLRNGLGHAKAFGCGLLLVRRIVD
ncbi:type I-E CRISPR-associated protein Cas6/Cse3/CasE [Azohydromonas aeria]|uniref:type I-E CRISPR-associated protein Cas6/Cse3/CasE n=1 Tax=Azohydromonas aeria TaxID=2590212 RepID=UPI0012FC94CE|nr:type I-E CRISPR-associated protein Cas6/Cse3/CasE [Azohydromonas aeria]